MATDPPDLRERGLTIVREHMESENRRHGPESRLMIARRDVVLAALGPEAATTSDLYDRVGYVALARVGLIPYPAFRDALVALAAAGLAESETVEDGATLWRRAGDSADRR
jgi:hypothetical protein